MSAGQAGPKVMSRSTRKIKRYALKVFSVFFAFFLWLYVLSSAVVKEEKVVPVEVTMPEGFSIQSLSEKDVRYELKGPRFFVRNFMQDHEKLQLDLASVHKKGKRRYDFNTADLKLGIPFGVELSVIEPAKIVVQVEKTMEKEIPVIANIEGEVPGDHKLIDSQIHPAKVMVSGPSSVVKALKELLTEKIELNGLTGKSMMKVGIGIVDERLRVQEPKVDFSYNIRPTRANVILEDIPVRFYSRRLIKRADRRAVNLMILADSKEKLEQGMSQIEVIARVDDELSGKIEVELSAELPAGLHLLEIQPKKIAVFVE